MAANVTQDSAVLCSLEKPGRSCRRAEAMWPQAKDMNHPANRALPDQVAGKHRALDVQPFAVIDHVLFAGLCRGSPSLCKLGQLSEGSLIGEIMLTGTHDPHPKRPPFRRHSSSRNELNLGIFQDLIKRTGNSRLRKCFLEGLDFARIGIENPAQLAACFNQPIALAVDMSMIQGNGGEFELARTANRCGFAFWRIIVTSLGHKLSSS